MIMAKVEIKLCKIHNKELKGESDQNVFLCPIGHVVNILRDGYLTATREDNVVRDQRPVAPSLPSRSLPPRATPEPPPQPVKEEPVDNGKKVLKAQNFHSLGGHKMLITLERSKNIPFLVRAKHIAEDGKSVTGVLERATTESEGLEKFTKRVKQAEVKGWRVGRTPRAQALDDIPDAPSSLPENDKQLRAHGRARAGGARG